MLTKRFVVKPVRLRSFHLFSRCGLVPVASVLCLLPGLAPAVPPVQFSAPASFAAGDKAYFVAARDLNGDAKLDLVVANANAASVSILLGHGDGTFDAATTYPVPQGPCSVAIGDVNGDGKLDLAVGVLADGPYMLLGNGDGTFSAGPNLGLDSFIHSLVLQDFNEDGPLDLVTANSASNSITVSFGDGSGSFTNSINYAVGSAPLAIAAADFDQDGKLDLATANNGDDTLTVLYGTGAGTFENITTCHLGRGPFSRNRRFQQRRQTGPGRREL